MMPTLIKKLKTYLCFSWVWLAGLLVWLLSASAPTTTLAQSDVLLCFGNSSIPIAPTSSYTLTEGGAPVTYLVRLCTQPQILVTVTLKLDSNAQQLLTIDRTHILFDQEEWATPEAVKVSAKENSSVNPTPQVAFIGHPAVSQDSNYNYPEIEEPRVKFTILDNEPPDDKKHNYLPMIKLDHTPTPMPTPTPTATPMRPAVWSQLATNPVDIEVLTINNNLLFAGDRSGDRNQQGIYHNTSSCAATVAFKSVRSNIPIEDLSFSGQFGIAATNGDRVYYSKDNGAIWQRTDSNMNRFVFAVAFTDANQAYAGADDGIYRSTDSGVTWVKVNPTGSGPTLINAFTYAKAENLLWIATYGGGVWKVTPGSTQFAQRLGGLANINSDRRVWDIFRRSGNEFYIATTNGVYRGDGEGDWQAFGLQSMQVLSLELVGNELYAGVRDGGVWKRTLGGTGDWARDSGIGQNLTVRDLFYDQSGLCNDPTTARKALLAGTTSGIWVYR